MRNLTFSIIFLTCAAQAIFADGKPTVTDFKLLSFPEKLGLLTLSTIQPERYNYLTWNALFNEDDTPWVDQFFVDIRSLLVQSKKVSEEAVLPEIDWSYRLTTCLLFCIDETVTLTTGSTKISGQNRTTSVNEVTATTFKNYFHAPEFIWKSPGFFLNVTDHIRGHQYLNSDVYLSLSNLTFNTTFSYAFEEDLGIQISNLTIDFEMGCAKTNIQNRTNIYSNGTVEVFEPIEMDITEDFTGDWPRLKNLYEPYLQFRINCLLSNFLSEPERCQEDGVTASKKYNQMNVMLLMGITGLGSMD